VRQAARGLKSLKSVDRVLYAMKANPNAHLLKALAEEGIGFECVSPGEVERVLSTLPKIERSQLLFTPNFAAREEYAWALEAGLQLTIDNLFVLRSWPELFRDRAIFVRIDTGTGRGHHHHVRTAGAHSKFGVPLSEMDELRALAAQLQTRIVGLHAHTGSGVFDAASWAETASVLGLIQQRFPDVRVIDVGGGLGVPENHEQPGLDLARLDAALLKVRQGLPGVSWWIEPGRYLVAAAGVLLARVTQTKIKEPLRYVGVATGMNSLIRPALYGAVHEMVNLTRLDEPATELVNVVGPICESGDFLGHERLLAPSSAGDVVLIANAGAYGRAMSSHYNLRAPATEIIL
jgi:diaminopimelate decarboxylase/aspartate kinase